MSVKKVIGIVGPSGAGKTTLAEGLARQYNLHVHLEKPSANPYLETFYQELQAGGVSPIALKSQLHFLLAAHQQAMEIRTHSESVVWDVPLYGHKMYADLLHEAGTMPDSDYQMYNQVYDACLQTIPQPNVLLIVTAKLPTLVKRIQKRGRAMELATPKSYWERQIRYWNHQAQTEFMDKIPTLTVDSGSINWTSAKGISQVWDLAQPLFA